MRFIESAEDVESVADIIRSRLGMEWESHYHKAFGKYYVIMNPEDDSFYVAHIGSTMVYDAESDSSAIIFRDYEGFKSVISIDDDQVEIVNGILELIKDGSLRAEELSPLNLDDEDDGG